jgi:DNA-binding MarR family transcriptional regulator
LHPAADEQGAGEKLAILSVSDRDDSRRQTNKTDCGHETHGPLLGLALAGEQRFMEDMARLLLPSGVPTVAARLYGYLLLCSQLVSLNQIAEDRGISKSTASVAARLLESYTLAHRHREPGTKRALYVVADDSEAIIRQQNCLFDALAERLNAGVPIAPSKGVSARLEEMADFYRVMRSATEHAIGRWKRSRP